MKQLLFINTLGYLHYIGATSTISSAFCVLNEWCDTRDDTDVDNFKDEKMLRESKTLVGVNIQSFQHLFENVDIKIVLYKQLRKDMSSVVYIVSVDDKLSFT
ncbi:MAG: hypothetical protein EKK64_03935 [Neisseriaceae bacterium]|nr:MAG: hypothetical protein EKK64_03935 [Neisseriaceae bacterium]